MRAYLKTNGAIVPLANGRVIKRILILRRNFSKNKDKAALSDIGFVNWFNQQGFPQESKNKIKELQNSHK